MGLNLRFEDNANLSLDGFAGGEYVELFFNNTSNYFGITQSGFFVSAGWALVLTIEIDEYGANDSTLYEVISYSNNNAYYKVKYVGRTEGNDENEFKIDCSQGYPDYVRIHLDKHKKFVIEQKIGSVKINGTTIPLYGGVLGSTRPDKIRIYGSAKIKIYSIKLIKNNELQRELIPVRSIEEGHINDPALYDTINNVYYYSTGFSPVTDLFSKLTKVFIKNCPNTVSSGHDILKHSPNLSRVRLDVGNISGPISELKEYADNLTGYNDNYEEQTKPRIVGRFTLNDYYTNAELNYVRSKIDGLTVEEVVEYNLDLINELGTIAMQTLDPNSRNYNPAAAIKLHNLGYGTTLENPMISGGGRWYLTTEQANNITSLSSAFRELVSVVDTEMIVSDDATQEYDFTEFDELQYFRLGVLSEKEFDGCSKLNSVIIPSTVSSLHSYVFRNCVDLETMYIPSSCNQFNGTSTFLNAFANHPETSAVYYGGTLERWVSVNGYTGGSNSNPISHVKYFYINNELVKNIVIPETVTSLKSYAFAYYSTLETCMLHSGVESIGKMCFCNCNNLTDVNMSIFTTTAPTLDTYVFQHCRKLKDLTIKTLNSIAISYWSDDSGDGTGTLRILSNINPPSNSTNIKYYYHDIIIKGNIVTFNTNNLFVSGTFLNFISNVQGESGAVVRIGGNINCNTKGSVLGGANYNLIELYGNINLTEVSTINNNNILNGECTTKYFHFYNDETGNISPSAVGALESGGRFYVGKGLSKVEDDAILDSYRNNSSWTDRYGAVFRSWFDYNDSYKTYQVIEDLDHVENTNQCEFPFIQKGGSYYTSIRSASGYLLDPASVRVEIFSHDSTDATNGGSYVDITSTTYDSNTKEISIDNITGNIRITASAIFDNT